MSLKSSCENPRDHVFGILSLLSPEIRALIAIDYTATEDQVLTQAVAACVFECGDLDILCFCELNQATDITLAPSFTEEHLKSFLDQRDVRNNPSQPEGKGSALRNPWLPNASVDAHPMIFRPTRDYKVTEAFERCVEPLCPWSAREVPLAFRHRHQIPKRQLLPALYVRAHLIDILIGCSDLLKKSLLKLRRKRPSKKWVRECF
jgi:hypothetical protein